MELKQKTKFKLTKIGMIPEDWDIKPLSEVITIIGGGTPKTTNSEYWGGDIPWISVVDFVGDNRWIHKTEKTITKRGLEESSTKLLHKGQLIVSARGTVGEIGQVTKDMAFNQSCYGIDGKEGMLNDFLYYLLKYKVKDLQSKTHGSVFNTITRNTFDQILVQIPDELEQFSISKILSDLDSKIELNQKMNKNLEEIGKAIFKHWFVDFEFPNEEGKPYRSSNGEMVNSELGEIPKSWHTGKLSECVNTVKGCSYRSEDLKESETALVTLKSFNRGGGFNQEGYKEYVGEYDEEQVLKNGEIVVAQTDLTQKAEVIGRPAIVISTGKYSKMVASLDLQIVRPKGNFSRNYAYYLLSTDAFHNHALSYTNGTTVLHLNKKAVPEFVSIIPPKEILNKFDRILDAMFEKIASNTTEIQTLSHLRDSLLPKLMSGKIRVPVEAR
jgi:type I restriction enzyme S subunit